MRFPGKKQKGESQEDYVRRISKFPTLLPHAIIHAVFPTVNQVTWQYIHNWARPVFPNVFPQTDWYNNPPDYTESISTKAFAKWVVEENIFEAWIELGEEVSPSAKLFIDLVNGKAIDSKQASKEVSLKSPRLGIGRVKMNRLHEDYVSAAKKMLDINSDLKWPDFKDSPKFKNLIRDSGLSPSESTLQRKWIPEARQLAKVKGTPGAPEKK
jgi:hypothetical protein